MWGVLVILPVLVVCSRSQLTPEQKADLSMKIQKLPYDVCGKSDIFKQKLDGSKATLGAYPWMAALGYSRPKERGPFFHCAGNLVADQFVLSVAVCLVPRRANKLVVVRLGDLDLNDKVNDGASPVDIEVETTIIHEGYDANAKINDIGLVKLKRKVQFDYTKKPICLPPPDLYVTSFVGYSSAIIGWGKDVLGASSALNEAAVDIQDFESCKRNYSSKISSAIMDERVFCASAPGRDACQGDGGGPLMMYRRYEGKHRMFLLGMVSYGYGCGLEGFPGVYTNVSSFMPWIVDKLYPVEVQQKHQKVNPIRTTEEPNSDILVFQ